MFLKKSSILFGWEKHRKDLAWYQHNGATLVNKKVLVGLAMFSSYNLYMESQILFVLCLWDKVLQIIIMLWHPVAPVSKGILSNVRRYPWRPKVGFTLGWVGMQQKTDKSESGVRCDEYCGRQDEEMKG